MAMKASIHTTTVNTQDGTAHKLLVEGVYLVIHNNMSNPPFLLTVDYNDGSDWDANVLPAIKAEIERYAQNVYGTTLFTAVSDSVAHSHRMEVL